MSLSRPVFSTTRSGISSSLGEHWPEIKGTSSSSSTAVAKTPLHTRLLIYSFRTNLSDGATILKLRTSLLYELSPTRRDQKSRLCTLLDDAERHGRLKLSPEQVEVLSSSAKPRMPGRTQEDNRLVMTFYNSTKVEIWDELDVYLLCRDGRFSVCMQVGFEVCFSYDMDLRSFPFDKQVCPIEMMLKFEDSLLFELVLYFAEVHKSCLQLNEYVMLPPTAARQSSRQTDLSLIIARKTTYWMVSFAIPLAALMLCSLLVFVLAADDASSRMGITFTSLLTVFSFRALLGSSLPRLGYSTLMDQYINASTVFSFFIAVSSSVVGPIVRLGGSKLCGGGGEEEEREHQEECLRIFDKRLVGVALAIYFVMHAKFFLQALELSNSYGMHVELPKNQQWACWQFQKTFFQDFPKKPSEVGERSTKEKKG